MISAAIAVTAVLLTGCSPSNPDAIEAAGISESRANDPVIPTGPGGAISIVAFDLGFSDLEGEAVDGAVTVALDNIGGAEHNFRIDAAAGDEAKVSAAGGESAEGDLLLFGAPGGAEYVYYCDIPGHRSAGMEGTLFVYATPEEAAENPVGTTVPVGG